MINLPELFYELFHGNRTTYAVQRRDAAGTLYYYRITGKEVTVDTYDSHLKGQEIIGIYPLLPDQKHCHFAAIDIDSPDLEIALKTKSLLPQPNYLERTRSGNYHIWMFFKEPANLVWLKRACGEGLNYAKTQINDHCGLYPVIPRTQGIGLLIALPLQRSLRAQGLTVFISDQGEEIADVHQYLSNIQFTKTEILTDLTLPAIIAQHKKLRQLWSGEGKKEGDLSASGYDFALARALLAYCSPKEVEQLLMLRPGVHSTSEEYVTHTVLAAAGNIEPTNEEVIQTVSWDDLQPINRETFYTTLKSEMVLEREQRQHIDIFLAVLVANLRTVGRPIWMLFIGPPGSGKTLPMMATQNSPYIYACSSFRPTTLISGWGIKGGADMSLIPKLDGKILFVKDMSSLLSQHRDIVTEVMGLLRDAYDGSCSRAYGTGIERSYTARFGFCGAATNDIDAHWGLNTRLGERFLRYRVRSTLDQVFAKIDKALSTTSFTGLDANEEQSENKLEDTFLRHLKFLLRPEIQMPKLSNPQQIGRLAQLGAILRTAVSRGVRANTVLAIPEWEEATRFSKQLAKMSSALALVREKEVDDEEEFEDLKILVRDGMDARVERICQAIYQCPGIVTADIAHQLSLPEWTIRTCLDDLEVSRLLIHTRDGYTARWSFVPWIEGQLRHFKLWPANEIVTEIVTEIGTLTKGI